MKSRFLWWWNLLHFHIYIWVCNWHLLFRYINPLFWLGRVPSVRKFWSKRGIDDINSFTDNVVFNNEISGVSTIKSGAIIVALTMLVEIIFYNLFRAVFKFDFPEYDREIVVWFLLLPALGVNYFSIFLNKKYLKYFSEFKKRESSITIKNGVICFAIIVLIVFSFFCSFRLNSQV